MPHRPSAQDRSRPPFRLAAIALRVRNRALSSHAKELKNTCIGNTPLLELGPNHNGHTKSSGHLRKHAKTAAKQIPERQDWRGTRLLHPSATVNRQEPRMTPRPFHPIAFVPGSFRCRRPAATSSLLPELFCRRLLASLRIAAHASSVRSRVAAPYSTGASSGRSMNGPCFSRADLVLSVVS